MAQAENVSLSAVTSQWISHCTCHFISPILFKCYVFVCVCACLFVGLCERERVYVCVLCAVYVCVSVCARKFSLFVCTINVKYYYL